ncbi:unnamed protein product [Cunninghamella blakesleeana]
MIQFYLYYMISVATWPPLSIPTIQSTNLNSNNSMYTNNYNNNNNNNNSFYSSSSSAPYGSPSLIASSSSPSSLNRPTTRSSNATIAPSSSVSGSVYGSSSTSSTLINSNQDLPYLIPGQVRSLQESIYSKLIQEYLHEFIPCIINESISYHPVIGTFFLDTIIEIWIRTVWLSSSQKLSIIYMQSIHQFIKYIVSGDLRRCVSYKLNNNNNNNNIDCNGEGEEGEEDIDDEKKDDSKSTTDYTKIYHLIKNEYYLLLSRLSINWRKQDDYIWVLDLWKLWAAPWRLGSDNLIIPTTTTTTTKIWDDLELKTIPAPLEDGWAFFILDNAWYYLTLVNQFLQRTATFTYTEKPILNNNNSNNALGLMTNNNNNNVNNNMVKPVSPVSSPLDGNSIYVELGILYQLLSIWKCKNVVSYLGLIEDGLEKIAHEKPMNQLNNNISSSSLSSNHSISSFMNKTRNKLISLSTSLRLQHGQSAKDELLETLAMISCHGNKSNTLPIQQKLRSIHDRIMSISNDQLHWQSINIYSDERHPRSETLIKTIDTLHNIIVTRKQQQLQQQNRGKLGAPNWTNTMILGQTSSPLINGKASSSSPSSSKKVISKELKSLMDSKDDILKLFKINTSSNEGQSTPCLTSPQNISIGDTTAPALNESNKIDKKGSSIKDTVYNTNINNNSSSSSNTFKPIPAYGPRAEEMVQSYENAYLVYWIVPFERKFNKLYSRWIVSWCPFVPNRIRYRWLAAPVNLVYLFFFFIVITVIIR